MQPADPALGQACIAFPVELPAASPGLRVVDLQRNSEADSTFAPCLSLHLQSTTFPRPHQPPSLPVASRPQSLSCEGPLSSGPPFFTLSDRSPHRGSSCRDPAALAHRGRPPSQDILLRHIHQRSLILLFPWIAELLFTNRSYPHLRATATSAPRLDSRARPRHKATCTERGRTSRS